MNLTFYKDHDVSRSKPKDPKSKYKTAFSVVNESQKSKDSIGLSVMNESQGKQSASLVSMNLKDRAGVCKEFKETETCLGGDT